MGITRNFWRDALGSHRYWELDFWGKFRRAIESPMRLSRSIANYDYVLVTLVGNVAATLFGIRTSKPDPDLGRI